MLEKSRTLPDDEVIQSHWAKYLSIITAGYLEHSLRIILATYADRCANVKVASFVKSNLSSFKNPSTGNINKLIGAFDKSWVIKLEIYWDDERKDAIASIMNIRHHVAHGRHMGTTIGQMTTYYKRSKEVIVFLHDLLLGRDAR